MRLINILLWFVVLGTNTVWGFSASEPAPFTLQLDGSGHEQIIDTVSDDDGSLYITGFYDNGSDTTLKIFSDAPADNSQRTLVNSYTLPENNGGQDFFIAKLNWLGELQWFKYVGGAGTDGATGVVYERRSEKIFITGYVTGTVYFDLQQINATQGSSGLDTASTTNLFIAIIDPASGEWLDVQLLPLNAAITDTAHNAVPGRTLQNLNITAGNKQQGNGLIMARDDADAAAPVVFYLKGKLNRSDSLQADVFPPDTTQWLARLGLSGGPQETAALLEGNAGGVRTNSAGDWSFVTKLRYFENPAVGQQTWNWDWLTRLNQLPEPQAGADDIYVNSCAAADIGANLNLGQQLGSDNSTVWQPDSDINSSTPELSLNFSDPLPTGAIITSINVALEFGVLLGQEHGVVSYLFDTRVGNSLIGQWSAPPFQAPGPSQYYPVTDAINYSSSPADYQYGAENSLTLRLVSGISVNFSKVVLTLNYTLPTGEICHTDIIHDMAVDPAQGINSPLFFAGEWRADFKVGPTTHQSEAGNNNGFAGSLSPSGSWRYFAKAGGRSSLHAVQLADNGNMMVAGYAGLSSDTASSVVLDNYGASANLAAITPDAYPQTNSLFAEIDPNGQWQWAGLNQNMAACYDLERALTGELLAAGVSESDNTGQAVVAQLAGADSAAFNWYSSSGRINSYAYHMEVNNLNTLFLFGGTQWYRGAPFTTTLTNNTLEYSDFDTTQADVIEGLGSLIHVLDPVTGDFDPEFQNYYHYIVGDLITPQVGGLNAQDTLGLRRTIPVNLGLTTAASGGAVALNEPLLTVQSDLSVWGAGPIERAVILWPTSNNSQATDQPLVGRAVKVRWPTIAEGLQEYLYSTTDEVIIPPVELNPENAVKHYHWLQYAESLAGNAVTEGISSNLSDQLETTASLFGSLVFFDNNDPTQGAPEIISVRSYHWDDALKHIDNIAVDIGKSLEAPTQLINAQTDAGGYVMTTLGRYDNDKAYNNESRSGLIVPVNQNGAEDLNDNSDYTDDFADDLRVAWYQRGARELDWPFLARSYAPQWPADAGQIVLASQLGSDGLQGGGEQSLLGLTLSDSPEIYTQNDRAALGFNPNEEHAFLRVKDDHYVVHATRNDLNHVGGLNTSDPYVLVRYPVGDDHHFRVFRVDYNSADYPEFELNSLVGNAAYGPSYIRDHVTQSTEPGNPGTQASFWIDRNNQVWSRSAGTPDEPLSLDVNYFYELWDPAFWYDIDGDGIADSETSEVAWMAYHAGGDGSTPHTLTFDNQWPEDVPTIYFGDTLINARNGLPGVRNMQYLQVIFDENDPIDESHPSSPTRHENASVRLFNYSAEIRDTLTGDTTYQISANSGGPVVFIADANSTVTLPARLRPTLGVNVYDFPRLPTDLRYRLRFQMQSVQDNPKGGYFYFRGGDFNPETGQDDDTESAIHLVNVMTAHERDVLYRLDNSGTDPFSHLDDEELTPWDTVVDNLYYLSRNPGEVDLDDTDGMADPGLYVGLEETVNDELAHQVVDSSVALTTAFASKPGYVVLAENVDDPNLTGNPVNLHVIRVADPLASGSVNVLQNELNKLDTRLVLRQNLDFAGRSNELTFEWYWTPADETSNEGPPAFNLDSNGRPIGWDILVHEANGEGVATYYLDSGLPLLADGWVLTRYRGIPTESDPEGEQWSDLSGARVDPGQPPTPMLVQGWVKRVMSSINEFEQRYSDFHANEVNSYTSMLVQAGPEYRGDVALNGEDGNLDNVGLIELYQTILNYAVSLSLNAGITDETAVNKQLLFAASRIASLYMLLGNEAFSDAMDPTIGNDGGGAASYLQPTLFAFENSAASLLDEELGLLRGLDNSNPLVGNRMLWNLVGGAAEATYVQVYGLSDTDGDGITDEAQASYPQGHGDAWGHYLTASKLYYSLARHPDYDWQPLTDTTSIAGQTLTVDYKDEERFARATAAKARTGARIVDLTFRNEYTHAPSAQWRGYKDTDTSRAWGMDGWARRAGQGAVLDWALANALLPYEDTSSSGVARIDRTTTEAIAELPAALVEIDSIVTRADRGNNPFGLASDAIPFDIDSNALTNGESHFEQIYARALDASNNALQLFNYANDITQQIRVSQLDNADFQQLEADKERDFKSRLIELMGYPYSGNIGPGKLYPTGYNGPDIYQYMYIDSQLPELPPSQLHELTLEIPGLVDSDCDQNCSNNITNFMFAGDASVAVNPDEHLDFINENGNLELTVPVSTAGSYPYIKGGDWGSRSAPGKIQLQLGEIQLIQARIRTALAEQQTLMEKIQSEIDLMETNYQIRANQINVYNRLKDEYNTLSKELAALSAITQSMILYGEAIYRWIGILQHAPAKTAGFSFDPGFIPRISLSVTYSALTRGLISAAAATTIGQFVKQSQVQQAAFNRAVEFQKSGYPIELQKQLSVIEKLMHEETKIRYGLVEMTQELDNARGAYQQLVAEAIRIMEERINFRKEVASRTTDERYRDMTYRVFRNDALQKYRASFDLAAKYTWLAAKAFDYETGLLSDDSNGVDQTFYESIIKERALGQYTDSGEPVAGVHGLSTPLARMATAFSSAESAFGGLDPLNQEFNFSLRKEAFRILDGEPGKDRWQTILQNARVSDLWQIPEFSEFCVAPGVSASDGPLAGIVLRFATTIHLDKNLFGWDKGSEDSTYSPSYSATKFYRVGLHFDDYPDELVNTPYAYLVPVGTDFLRSPTDITELRSYQVLDQAIPVPTDLTSGDTSYQQEGWIPNIDGVLTRWDRRRRFSELPVSASPVFDFENVTTSGRLVGRSVWNTEWVLIIPGKSLAADGELGLDILINGASGSPTNQGVDDIRLVFDTYSFPAQ